MEPGAAAGAGDDLLRLIDHVAVCVPAGELDPTIAFHEQVFGFTVIFQEYIEVGDQGMMSKVVQSPSGGVTFTILEPDLSRQAGQIDDFLAWHGGAGVQHVAFLTKDIVRAVRTFTEPRRRVRGDAVELLRHAGRAPGRDRHPGRGTAAARHPGRPRPLGADVPDLREVDAHQAHVLPSS